MYACANPFDPPADKHIVRVNYTEDTEVPIGTTVQYKCEDGFYFAEDFSMIDFYLTCLPDGNWTKNETGRICVDPLSKHYFNVAGNSFTNVLSIIQLGTVRIQ